VVDEPSAESLDTQVLDVYVSRDGRWWNPDHGNVEIPDGWAFLPAGDAYLTRTVSAAGAHWIAWQPGSRRRGRHRRRLGVWAPEATIELAELQAEHTQDERARARQRGLIRFVTLAADDPRATAKYRALSARRALFSVLRVEPSRGCPG
jgi:hypothetical protein